VKCALQINEIYEVFKNFPDIDRDHLLGPSQVVFI